ncbi:MAG: lysophospholipid acyltransferase family protein [Fidelibacterota bacterium]
MIINAVKIALIFLWLIIGVVFALIFLPIHSLIMIIWSRVALVLIGVRLEVGGRNHLPKGEPSVLVINHESALDIPVAVAATRVPVRFMAKKELFRLPFFGWVLKWGGHIPIDRKNRQKALQAIEKVSGKLIRRSISIIVSPEGTRSSSGRILPFKKGAFRLAHSHKLPLIPVILMGSRYCIPNKSFRIYPGVVKVVIEKPVYTEQYETIETCLQHVRNLMIGYKDRYEKSI